jgi:hypothetical protein
MRSPFSRGPSGEAGTLVSNDQREAKLSEVGHACARTPRV